LKFNIALLGMLIFGGIIGVLSFLISRRKTPSQTTASATVPDCHMITYRGARIPRSRFYSELEEALQTALHSGELLVVLLALSEVELYKDSAFRKESMEPLYDSVKKHAIDLAKEMEFDSILEALYQFRDRSSLSAEKFLREFAGVCSQKQARRAVARKFRLDSINPELANLFRDRLETE